MVKVSACNTSVLKMKIYIRIYLGKLYVSKPLNLFL